MWKRKSSIYEFFVDGKRKGTVKCGRESFTAYKGGKILGCCTSLHKAKKKVEEECT